MRIVSIVEATTVSGPMKPLLMFSRLVRRVPTSGSETSHSVITTARRHRASGPIDNDFLRAAAAFDTPVDVVHERFAFDPGVLPQIARYLAAREPDVIETHNFKSHFLLWLLRRCRSAPGARWVAFHHGYTTTSLAVRLYQQLDRISLPAADRVITLCKPFARELERRGVARHRISVIANAVEQREPPSAPDVLALRKQLGIGAGERVVLTVGRLSPEKGHGVLIAALRRVLSARDAPDVRLLIVGHGLEEARLRRATGDMADRVVFAGYQADPWLHYHLADVFALPSYSEGSPLVLFEAMLAGVPIVASDVGGIPEVVRDGESALLVPPRDVDRLASALAALLKDDALRRRLSAAARDTLESFSPQQYTRNLLALHAELRSSGGS